MPVSRASAIAVSAARDITRCPMPLSPSTSAVAGADFVTAMFGRGLKPPAFRRRTYCGRRNTPCASAPVRSASAISAAHFAAAARGNPAAASASSISPLTAATGTHSTTSVLLILYPRRRLPRHVAYRCARAIKSMDNRYFNARTRISRMRTSRRGTILRQGPHASTTAPKGEAMTTPPRVVIVGAGFGGLTAAKALSGQPFNVTVIDQHNYHLFQPLLYQVATAGLSPAEIASPIRAILSGQRNVNVMLGKVSGVDTVRREVLAEGRRIPYDTLILATGVQHAYF